MTPKQHADTPNSRIAFTNSPMEEDSTISSIFTQGPVAINEETGEAFAAYARCKGGPENWPPRTRQQSARTRTRVNGASNLAVAIGFTLIGILLGALLMIAIAVELAS